jgi:transposase-like protein
MVLEPVLCPDCSSDDGVRYGRSSEGKQRDKCRNRECCRSTFIRHASARNICEEIDLENFVQLCQEAINALSPSS